MAKWKYNLPNSSTLRQAVEDENSEEILKQIVEGYKWMAKTFDEDMTSEIESVNDDIECQAFDEDSVNYHLNAFYDECDCRKVWIEL